MDHFKAYEGDTSTLTYPCVSTLPEPSGFVMYHRHVLPPSTVPLRLQIVTIATEETDGYKRFMHSANQFGLNVTVRVSAYYCRIRDPWLNARLPFACHFNLCTFILTAAPICFDCIPRIRDRSAGVYVG